MSIVSEPRGILEAGPGTLATPIGFGTASAAAEGIGFKDVTRILRQRILLIVITTALAYALIVAATFITLIYFPAWKSEAIFEMIPPRAIALVADPQYNQVNPAMMEQLLQTEARKLRELELLYSVVEKPEVKATRYYEWYESDARKAAVGLQRDLSSNPIANTMLISVSLQSRDARESKLIVEKLVQSYYDSYRQTEENQLKLNFQTLENTKSELIKSLDAKRAEIARFREQRDIPATVGGDEQYLINLRLTLSALDQQIASLQAQIASTSGYDLETLPLTSEDQIIIEADPVLRYYRAQVEFMDIQLSESEPFYGSQHKTVRIVRERRNAMAQYESARREELITQVRSRRLESLRQRLAEYQSMQFQLQDQLEDAEVRRREIDRSAQQFQMMLEDKDLIMANIQTVDEALTEAQHAMRDKSRATLRVVQQPQQAVEPSRPVLVAWLGGGVFVAIAIGIGMAFLREFTDSAIRTPLDVARFCKLPVLGSVPLIDDEEADVEEIEEAVRMAPQSLVAESFRKVRTNLQYSGPLESQRVLLVTSPSPGDGKTAVAINLAATFANAGERVLLIDCNFRRPALRARFTSSRPEGLSNVLVGQITLAEAITPSGVAKLDLLTSGPMPPTPAELLGSAQMRSLFTEARGKYDRIVLDGPPTLLISDAIVLATQVDGVLLVAQADANTKGTLKRAREQLDAINARIVGTVLNGVRARAGGYFRQQYRAFYDYTSDDVAPAELMGPAPVKKDDHRA